MRARKQAERDLLDKIEKLQEAVKALDNFILTNQLEFVSLPKWSCRHSSKIAELIEKHKGEYRIELCLEEFREYLGLKPSDHPRHISSNVLPKLVTDISKLYKNFQLESI